MKFLSVLFCLCMTVCTATELPFSWGGDIRIKWNHSDKAEYLNYEGSLFAKIEHENAWLDTKVKLAVDDWIDEINIGRVSLEKALVGYRFAFLDNANFFAEVGHAKLDYLFESKLQNNSYFNGLHIGYSLNDFYIHAVLNRGTSFSSHYSYMGEATYTWTKIPLNLSYSVTQWQPKNDFFISQLKGFYSLRQLFNKSISIYAAILRNHKASSEANGYYAGILIGKILKARDYEIDLNYQYCCKNAVPEFDYNGIGHGIQLKGRYAVTDSFSLQGKLNFVDKIKAEVSAIYSW